MSEQILGVPIVHQDLRQEEAVVQIADSLAHLQKCANCVFAKIDARLEQSGAKLRAVQDRIAICRLKVDKIASTKRATKVIFIFKSIYCSQISDKTSKNFNF